VELVFCRQRGLEIVEVGGMRSCILDAKCATDGSSRRNVGSASPLNSTILSCELSPGESVGPLVQEEFPEVVIGVEGQGEATVDGRRHARCSGDAVYLPLGSVLAIENRTADAALRYLIIKARE
jgi:quercetin dioxygenase-like cupin family protein